MFHLGELVALRPQWCLYLTATSCWQTPWSFWIERASSLQLCKPSHGAWWPTGSLFIAGMCAIDWEGWAGFKFKAKLRGHPRPCSLFEASVCPFQAMSIFSEALDPVHSTQSHAHLMAGTITITLCSHRISQVLSSLKEIMCPKVMPLVFQVEFCLFQPFPGGSGVSYSISISNGTAFPAFASSKPGNTEWKGFLDCLTDCLG